MGPKKRERDLILWILLVWSLERNNNESTYVPQETPMFATKYKM